LSTKINKSISDRNGLFALDRQMSAQIHISKIRSMKDILAMEEIGSI